VTVSSETAEAPKSLRNPCLSSSLSKISSPRSSCSRRALVVQVVERPLCLRLATPESVYQEIEADRLLRREPLLVLDYFGVVEPFLGVTVRFLESPLFEELDEVSLGVRRDDDIEVRGKRALNAETA